MNTRKLFGLATILGIILVSNCYASYINLYTEGIVKHYNFESASGDFQFTAIPSKGRGLEMMKRQYENHLQKEGTERAPIYRTFRRQPLKFWNWYNYATDELYQYPYKAPKTKMPLSG